ncbi:origin recognition complex subunit 5-like isoform X2 [Artemia franciscana]|uniref:origin recognition complex subunit 5-like isoform X2 n=1 Tax=Artemia franciscana TaxID=6661 RepID=UPI0032D9C97F
MYCWICFCINIAMVKEVLHRDEQTKIVSTLLQSSCLPVSLFLYGLPSTGKKAVVSHFLHNFNGIEHATVSCGAAYTLRNIWESLLNQIAGFQPTQATRFASFLRCDSFCDFLEFLPQALDKRCRTTTARICLVFEDAEKLRDIDETILSSLLRLQEFTKLNICVILISCIPFEKFRSGTGFREPFQIHFPQYKKEEIMDIMVLDKPEDTTEEFYRKYVRLLLSVFWTVCRDLSELRYMAQMNFQKYCRPITEGQAEVSDQLKLWKNAEPIFRKSLSAIYSRELSNILKDDDEDETNQKLKAVVDLPFFTKYLLIAAFLASYNPSKYDKRLFVKHHGKQRKTKSFTAQKERYNSQLLGPKPFPLDRLLAIFYAIVEEKVAPSANIFSQVSSLVTLRLVSRIGHSMLENPKYRCAVNLDFIRKISRTVGFEIIPYLYDRGIST